MEYPEIFDDIFIVFLLGVVGFVVFYFCALWLVTDEKHEKWAEENYDIDKPSIYFDSKIGVPSKTKVVISIFVIGSFLAIIGGFI